jgi:chitinase
VLLVVLALGVLGVIYLLSRSPAKTAAGANVTVTISPTEAQVAAGQAQDFSATVTGSGDTDVSWSIAEGSTGGKVVNHGAQAEGGTVTTQAVYVAPTTPGTYHVIATSHADQSKSATAEVTVSGK